MRTTAASTLAALMLIPAAAFAQGETSPSMPAPTMTETAPPPPPDTGPVSIKLHGLVDTFYLWNFTGDPSRQGPAGRAFDTNANSFTLNYLKVGGTLDAGMVGFRFDVGFGNTAAIINGASLASGPGGTDPTADSGIALSQYTGGVLVQQAFATLKLLDGNLTIDAGRFVTHAGAEVIEANLNWLYSRSLLFFGIPVLHTGVRATYTISPLLSVMLSVQNSQAPLDPDNNGAKTFGVNVLLTPMDTTTLALTGYFGEEPSGADDEFFMLIDLVANHKVNDQLALNLNFDFSKFGDAQWWGVSVMGRFILSEALYLAARGEFLDSTDGGWGGIDGSVYEGTVMLGVPFGSNFEMRVEGRADLSSEDVIFSKGGEMRSNQVTGLVSFLAFTN